MVRQCLLSMGLLIYYKISTETYYIYKDNLTYNIREDKFSVLLRRLDGG
jgi:hypothetical protein